MQQRCYSMGRSPRRESGILMPLFAIAMLAILAIAGLALDGAHAMLSKTRLQNVVDAAALSAAKTLMVTGDAILADAEARQTFAQNAALAGNGELASAYNGGEITLSITFSQTLVPFVPGTSPEEYVRVAATDFRLTTWLTRVLGHTETNVAASAVAGPQYFAAEPPPGTEVCNIAPMMVCGDPNDPDDPDDDSDSVFGYTLDQVDVLKQTSQGQIGPGNFQLFQLGSSPSGSDIRDGMAGAYDQCYTVNDSVTIDTAPGNKIGPAFQGLNTRFGEYQGGGLDPDDYPPDVITTQSSENFSYDPDTDTIYYGNQPFDPATQSFFDYYEYREDLDNATEGGSYQGTPGRRLLAAAVGDCTDVPNGQAEVPLLGFLCYYLIQDLPVGQGNEAEVFGQFISDPACLVSGSASTEPPEGEVFGYKIVLYKDESAEAS